MNQITRILEEIQKGNPSSAERLFPLVYDELRQLATAKLMQERSGHTLQPTALVHEAYLRLVDVSAVQHWDSRGHFFCAAAEAMRRVLVERARKRDRVKHGGKLKRVPICDIELVGPLPSEEFLALNEALEKLAQEDVRKAELVKLRFFVGMTVEEAARTLEISGITAKRYWRYIRAWLHRELSGE